LCPSVDRGCYGCFGPKETPNSASLTGWLADHGTPDREIALVFRTFNAASEEFAAEAQNHDPSRLT
jgi:hypothetical protein